MLSEVGLPAVIRPSFTLGGSAPVSHTIEKSSTKKVQRGLDLSPVSEVLVEESILGWKEYEMEVMRDARMTMPLSFAQSRTLTHVVCTPVIQLLLLPQ